MFETLLKEIKKYDSIVVFGHVFPDGDCYGSQIAVKNTIKLAFPEKKVYAVGSGCHRFFGLLGKMDVVSDEVIKNSLAILVDANDFTRSEDQRIRDAKAWIKIDHHVDTGGFTEGPFVVVESACSACEIVTDMVRELDLPVDATVASALFLGILTDTGRFQFIEDFAKIFSLVSWLCTKGANPKEINRILNITDEASLSFKGYVFSNYKKTKAGTVYLVIDKETLKQYNMTASKAGSMVNLISNLNGYPIWAFFCEEEKGTTHCEFRSNGPAVQPIALKHGGGGHLLASGATLAKFDINEINEIVSEMDEAIIEFGK